MSSLTRFIARIDIISGGGSLHASDKPREAHHGGQTEAPGREGEAPGALPNGPPHEGE